jgi:hypothetical protein
MGLGSLAIEHLGDHRVASIHGSFCRRVDSARFAAILFAILGSGGARMIALSIKLSRAGDSLLRGMNVPDTHFALTLYISMRQALILNRLSLITSVRQGI